MPVDAFFGAVFNKTLFIAKSHIAGIEISFFSARIQVEVEFLIGCVFGVEE